MKIVKKIFLILISTMGFASVSLSLSSISPPDSILNKNTLLSLNEKLGFQTADKTKTLVYGIININCPCSRDSLKSFQDVQKQLPKDYELVIIDIGATSEINFQTYKNFIKPTFRFYFDPNKKSVEIFKSTVTPSAYVVKEGQIIYQSAVINPAKNLSKNYLAEALRKIKNHQKIVSQPAFGCFIEKDL